MNIFGIEGSGKKIDWIKSAQSQDNYRVVKMILESCQMLCTNLNFLYGKQVSPYRSCHLNHPSTKWARASSANFLSLIAHTRSLIAEYKDRFGEHKVHKCESVLWRCIELYDKDLFDKHEETELPMAMPEEFKSENIVESYRKFYASKPRIRYPEDKVPSWFDQYRGDQPYEVINKQEV